jgi:integrase
MALKKKKFEAGEIMIFGDVVIYKRGEYWQFRMWLNREKKYARKSLHTRSETTAIEKGKNAYLEIYSNMQNGKTYFSLTTKHGVYKAVGIDSASSHSGRRTFLTALAEKGVNVRVIMQLAGHRSMATTQRYIETSPEMIRRALELV